MVDNRQMTSGVFYVATHRVAVERTDFQSYHRRFICTPIRIYFH